MEGSSIGQDLLAQLSGKKNILDDVENLAKKYRAPTSEDVTEMLGKKVTDEIMGSTKTQKMLDFDHMMFQ